MAGKKIHLRVVTPVTAMIDEPVDMVIMRCTTGDLGVLPGHEARTAVLDFGVMRVFNDADEHLLAVFGGLVEIKDDVVTVLANDIELQKDIDLKVALAEREKLMKQIREDEDDLSLHRHQILLRRSLVRIEVSSYPLISK